MRVFLVGVSCVGKTTIGKLLAKQLDSPFFDLDKEIENHFGMSIEKLQAKFLAGYSYRKEVSIVLKKLSERNSRCVIALPPSGLRDAFGRLVRKINCVTVAIEDTPANILARVEFHDIDSRPIAKNLTEKEKNLYMDCIKEDITFFRKSYRRADLHANISGLNAEQSAGEIKKLLAVYCGNKEGDKARTD